MLLLALLLLAVAMGVSAGPGRQPNIIVFITDDQDYVLGSTDARWMPSLDKYLRKQGLELPHFVTSIASCCPSRTSFLTGRYCHNTNITSNGPERGSAIKFLGDGLDDDYLPVWLQSAGYNTYLVGKFLNGFKETQAREGCPKGWTVADPIVQQDDLGEDGQSEDYPLYPTYMTNCQGDLQVYTYQYHEEVIRSKALQYIDDAASRAAPFFMYVSTVAPHDGKGFNAYPQVPPAYQKLFPGATAPRTGNWGHPVPSAIGLSSQTPRSFNETDIDGRFRARVQSLRAVDDTIDAVMRRLACHGLSDDTVVMFTSDNGFKLGNHNMAQEKFTYFEEDVRVPLLMAGPGVPRGVYAAEVAAALTDLTATIVHMAGASTGNTVIDGAHFPLERIAAFFPTPNQPGVPAAATRPSCPGQADRPLSPPSSPPPSPRPPHPRNRPPARKPPRPQVVPGQAVRLSRGSGRRLQTWAAAEGAVLGQQGEQQPQPQEDAAARSTSSMAVAAGAGGGFTEWSPVRELLAGLGGSLARVRAVAEGRRSLLQSGMYTPQYYGNWSNVQLIEAWLDGKVASRASKDYRALRACSTYSAFGSSTDLRSGGHTCYKYLLLCNPKNHATLGTVRQLFDLGRDPVEVVDLYTRYKQPFTGVMKRLVDRLDAVLTVMSYCSGATCRNPFIVIHPDGSVSNLAQAMDSLYDQLYSKYKKLSYRRCANYYHPENDIADSLLVPERLRQWGTA